MARRTTRLRTRLERERRAANLTQTDLARLSRTPQSTISHLESGEMFHPRYDTLARIAWALTRCGRDVKVEDLLPGRQPVLVKGLLKQPRRRSGVA